MNQYNFGGESREERHHYAVLVLGTYGSEFSVNFHKGGYIDVTAFSHPVPLADIPLIVAAAVNDKQVQEQVSLFLAGKACADLTGM